MTTYDNTNRGALFKDERKAKPEDRDYSGTLNVDGTAYWVSGWVKTSQKTGQKFLSLSVKPKAEQPDKSKPVMDDAIPF